MSYSYSNRIPQPPKDFVYNVPKLSSHVVSEDEKLDWGVLHYTRLFVDILLHSASHTFCRWKEGLSCNLPTQDPINSIILRTAPSLQSIAYYLLSSVLLSCFILKSPPGVLLLALIASMGKGEGRDGNAEGCEKDI